MFTEQNLAVLYIENNPEIRKKGSALISENGMKVFESSNTINGRKLFSMNEINIIMIDLELPENSGLDFVIFVRKM
jgi:DNA-binding response OmpR family regulator